MSFSVSPGEMLRVEGSNGSGKTTLLRILCGLYLDYTGEVLWDLPDYPLYVGHRPGVKDQLTARENLRWLASLYEATYDDDRIDQALAQVGLAGYEQVTCGAMSQGQRKRVNLARLCLLESPAWLLDEPFSSIDVDGVAQLEELIKAQLHRGGLVLLISHQGLSVDARVQSLRLGNP
ncbi:MAG: cytochrome c biogenesis heme-transporting ATPase CcmA [Pseudomonadales bacterium]